MDETTDQAIGSIDSGTFRRRIMIRVVGAMVMVPLSGILIMTFLGVYPWPDLWWVLIEYGGVVVGLNMLFVVLVARASIDRIVETFESGARDQRDRLAGEIQRYLAPVFFGYLVLYAAQGAVSANLSLEHFHGYDLDVSYYLLTLFGVTPTLLITAFLFYFSITDQLGYYLAPRGMKHSIAPLSVKYTILGLFTPLLIDTVLLLYYYDRTKFLEPETIGLWVLLLVFAGLGTRLAWRSMTNSLAPINRFLVEAERASGVDVAAPIPITLDEIGTVIGRYADVLERNKEIETDLVYERKLANAMIENANALVIVLNRQGKIVRFNRACERLSGFQFSEVRDRHPWDCLLDPVEAEVVREFAFEALAGNPQKLIGNYTNFWVSKSGERFLVEWSNSMLLDGRGEMEYMISVGIDITEKQKAEDALIESYQQQKSLLLLSQKLETALTYEDLFRVLSEEIRTTTGIMNHWLYVRDENDDRYCQLVGDLPEILKPAGMKIDLNRLDMHQTPYLQGLLEAEDVAVLEDASNSENTKLDVSRQIGLRTVIHIPFLVEGKWYGMFGMATVGSEGVHVPSPGELTYLRSVGTTVAAAFDRIRLVRELRIGQQLLEQRVDERTRELREAQAELLRRERLSTLGQLTATVSHELRNPLGAMRPSAYLLRRKYEDDPATVRALDRIERSIERCDHIIDELLDFTRITQLELSHQELDQWVAEVLKEQRLPGDLEVQLHRGLDGYRVDFDPHRLRRALINIIDNAAQSLVSEADGAVANDAVIQLTTRVHDGRVEMVLQDNGPGIAPDVLPKIFEPLYSTKNFGVGLGMPTVRQIMEQHHGGIDVESVPGKGTTVTLWLPIDPPAEADALH